MRFVLLINTDEYGNTAIDSSNQEVPEETIILYTETWLEYFKKKAKQPIRDSLA